MKGYIPNTYLRAAWHSLFPACSNFELWWSGLIVLFRQRSDMWEKNKLLWTVTALSLNNKSGQNSNSYPTEFNDNGTGYFHRQCSCNCGYLNH